MNRDYLDGNCIREDSIIFYRYLLKLGMNNKFFKEDKESPQWQYKDGRDKYPKKAKLFFERKDGLIKEIYYENQSIFNDWHKLKNFSLKKVFPQNSENKYYFRNYPDVVLKSKDPLEKVIKNYSLAMKDLQSIIYDMIKEEFIEDEENTNTLDDLYNYHCHINNLASNFKVSEQYGSEETIWRHYDHKEEWLDEEDKDLSKKLEKYNFINEEIEENWEDREEKIGKVHYCLPTFLNGEIFFIHEINEWKYFLPVNILEDVSEIEVIIKDKI